MGSCCGCTKQVDQPNLQKESKYAIQVDTPRQTISQIQNPVSNEKLPEIGHPLNNTEAPLRQKQTLPLKKQQDLFQYQIGRTYNVVFDPPSRGLKLSRVVEESPVDQLTLRGTVEQMPSNIYSGIIEGILNPQLNEKANELKKTVVTEQPQAVNHQNPLNSTIPIKNFRINTQSQMQVNNSVSNSMLRTVYEEQEAVNEENVVSQVINDFNLKIAVNLSS